jgi:hypothetical protein
MLTIKRGSQVVRREFLSTHRKTTIGRKDVVHNRPIDKRFTKISRTGFVLFCETFDKYSAMMLHNTSNARLSINAGDNNYNVEANEISHIESGAHVVLHGMQDEDRLCVEYALDNDIFLSKTDSDTEEDEPKPPARPD